MASSGADARAWASFGSSSARDSKLEIIFLTVGDQHPVMYFGLANAIGACKLQGIDISRLDFMRKVIAFE
ncbi:hypothetical protein FA145_12215 [Pseudomonas aeruginosa]|nr:hypothetical protein [Pseudomonas aeruginosa]